MEQIRRAEQIINPGPVQMDVLTLQMKHRSQNIWRGEECSEVYLNKGGVASLLDNINPKIYEKIIECGFEGVVKIGTMIVDHKLINAMVERWRPETFTFHLSVGEATITLQDVEVLTGLRVDGDAVTGVTKHPQNLYETCENLLGKSPRTTDVSGSNIRLKWFRQEFSCLPIDADQCTIDQYTRAFLMQLFGGLLFSNTCGNSVHVMWLSLLRNLNSRGVGRYAWGAAVLAYLYRELSKATRPGKQNMCGYFQLVQVWAFERIKNIVPRLSEPRYQACDKEPYAMRWKGVGSERFHLEEIRRRLDCLPADQFVWTPYDEILELLPEYCTRGNIVWRAIVPIVSWHIVEFHHPDRCMRQFGFDQPIPQAINPAVYDLQTIKMTGYTSSDWGDKHAQYIAAWNSRLQRIAAVRDRCPAFSSPQALYQSQYMRWYLQITRRWISPTGAAANAVGDGLQQVYYMEGGETYRQNVRNMVGSMLGGLNQEYRMERIARPHVGPPPIPYENVVNPAWLASRLKRTFDMQRDAVPFPPFPEGIQQIPGPYFFPMHYGNVGPSVGRNDAGPSNNQNVAAPSNNQNVVGQSTIQNEQSWSFSTIMEMVRENDNATNDPNGGNNSDFGSPDSFVQQYHTPVQPNAPPFGHVTLDSYGNTNAPNFQMGHEFGIGPSSGLYNNMNTNIPYEGMGPRRLDYSDALNTEGQGSMNVRYRNTFDLNEQDTQHHNPEYQL